MHIKSIEKQPTKSYMDIMLKTSLNKTKKTKQRFKT